MQTGCMMMTSVSTPCPRITIQFCTQCRWMLRAAYYAQELLSTFSTSIGEVALQPSTGGTFIVEIFYIAPENPFSYSEPVEVQRHVLWDFKVERSFPETKELKRRVRDVIDPGRDLGHVDGKKKSSVTSPVAGASSLQVLGDEQSKKHQRRDEDREGGVEEEREENATLHQPGRSQRAISNLHGSTQDGERGFTPIDFDGAEMAPEKVQADIGQQVKRNPDGNICEDCN